MADNERGRGDRDENQENRNECKSAKAIKLLWEVASLLSEGDSDPYQPLLETRRSHYNYHSQFLLAVLSLLE